MLSLDFADFTVEIEPEQLMAGARMVDGEVVNQDGECVLKEDGKVEVSFLPSDAKLSDNAEEGMVTGNIISFLFVDDHYMYTVRSKSEEDYLVDDEDLWNQEDYVGIVIPKEKLSYRIVNEKNS